MATFEELANVSAPQKPSLPQPTGKNFEVLAKEQNQFGNIVTNAMANAFGVVGGATSPVLGNIVGTLLGKKVSKKAVDEVSRSDIKGAFIRGGRNSASGILLGLAQANRLPKETETLLEHFAELAGRMGADLPIMYAGGELGALAGGAAGSVIPGAGTAAGAVVGGAAGALALPTLIETSYSEYRNFVDGGGKLTFGEFLKRAGRIAKETGKSGVLGITMAGMGKAVPLLRKIPGFSKILDSKPGKMAAETAAELAGLTGVSAAMEGELPSAQQVVDNALVLASFKGARFGGRKGKKFFTELAHPETKTRAEAFMKLLPEKTQKYLKEKYPTLTEKTQKQKFRQILRDNLGERNAKIYETQTELTEAFEKAQSKKKFTPKQLEEAIYLKQKTGNPEIKGDTYEKLAKRTPKELRTFVEKDITNHFAKMAEMWNKNPRTKNINPREVLREIYMPGLYEYDTKQFNKAYDQVAKKFNIENPFAKPKEFLTFLDAFKEAGLKPRFKNIMEFVNSYNNKVIKTMSNIKLLEDIAEHRKDNPEPLVVTTFDGKSYKDAKAAGYVPFDDPFLRSHKLEPTAKGQVAKRMWKTSDSPALVHPDFADVFRGAFSKEAYRGATKLDKIMESYDKASDLARYTRVEMSPFHYFSLMESAVGSGIAYKQPNWYSEGGRLRQNKAIMSDAIKHGLKLDYRVTEAGGKKGFGVVSRGLEMMKKGADNLPENLASKSAQKGLSLISKGTNHLFEEFHPRLKLSTYNHYVNQEVMRRVKAGQNLTPENVNLMKQGIADFVNNIYGGQNWEYMQFFNDSKNVKNIRRLVGYPDWSISTIRQALDATAPGVKGKIARQYWKRYGVGMLGITGTLKFLTGGLTQRDDKTNSILGLGFDYQKGFKELFKKGPRAMYVFPLPDVNVRLPYTNVTVNPGRDWKGFKMVGHFGKQALELGNYFMNPIQAFYSKSNPLMQDIITQIWGGSPKAGGNIWKAEAAYDKYGQLKPWGAKDSFAGQMPYRVWNVLKNKLPFSAQTLSRTGMAPFAMSLFGAYPISKSINTFTARPFLEDAAYEKDNEVRSRKLKAVQTLMREGGLSDKVIKTQTSKVVNAVEKEQSYDELKAAVKSKNLAKINSIRIKMLRRGVKKQTITTFIKKLKSE